MKGYVKCMKCGIQFVMDEVDYTYGRTLCENCDLDINVFEDDIWEDEAILKDVFDIL